MSSSGQTLPIFSGNKISIAYPNETLPNRAPIIARNNIHCCQLVLCVANFIVTTQVLSTFQAIRSGRVVC